jgi:hypothetical protein
MTASPDSIVDEWRFSFIPVDAGKLFLWQGLRGVENVRMAAIADL